MPQVSRAWISAEPHLFFLLMMKSPLVGRRVGVDVGFEVGGRVGDFVGFTVGLDVGEIFGWPINSPGSSSSAKWTIIDAGFLISGNSILYS
jgi:hypothetical protein